MEYNFVTNVESCYIEVSNLLFYSHIPTAVVALLMGLFVFFSNKKLVSKLLLAITTVFLLWSISDLVTWYSKDSSAVMFFWSLTYLLDILIFLFSFYFAYVLVTEEDIEFSKKIIMGIILLPFLIIIPINYGLELFVNPVCEAKQGYLLYFQYIAEVIISIWIFIFFLRSYFNANKEGKKQILYASLGIVFFLAAFYWTSLIGNFTNNWNLTQYGLFGMTFFIGMLAVMIVKFKTFDIKMLAAEALVVVLVILPFSLFFFFGIENVQGTIVISITVLFTTLSGIWLINSVRNEVKRKEELQAMSGKLSEANDQLRKLDNSKSEFISIASHQLRTPLTAIKGFVSLLLEGSYGVVDQKQQEVLNKVYTSNERLVNLVEDLLNVSRMESGRMEFKFAPWKVDAICQEVVDTFYPKSKDLGLYLEYKKPETELPEVMIDGTKVREVISNLVDNALKYTPKGGVSLRVELANSSKYQVESSKGNNVIRVTISDTGIGVPVTELPYLFAKFSRGKDISRLNTGGTGLGLYVGKSMIEQNGGKIWAESDGEGKGSRFIIEIPLKQSAELMERWG